MDCPLFLGESRIGRGVPPPEGAGCGAGYRALDRAEKRGRVPMPVPGRFGSSPTSRPPTSAMRLRMTAIGELNEKFVVVRRDLVRMRELFAARVPPRNVEHAFRIMSHFRADLGDGLAMRFRAAPGVWARPALGPMMGLQSFKLSALRGYGRTFAPWHRKSIDFV